eukprot:GEMP01014481.1.p1 GENE.GEMP01014481.1~~GEMP01014481.1.p1  ORF type:complete len:641 (+),score=103.01 GEMP01014481.1:324-2246(+)
MLPLTFILGTFAAVLREEASYNNVKAPVHGEKTTRSVMVDAHGESSFVQADPAFAVPAVPGIPGVSAFNDPNIKTLADNAKSPELNKAVEAQHPPECTQGQTLTWKVGTRGETAFACESIGFKASRVQGETAKEFSAACCVKYSSSSGTTSSSVCGQIESDGMCQEEPNGGCFIRDVTYAQAEIFCAKQGKHLCSQELLGELWNDLDYKAPECKATKIWLGKIQDCSIQSTAFPCYCRQSNGFCYSGEMCTKHGCVPTTCHQALSQDACETVAQPGMEAGVQPTVSATVAGLCSWNEARSACMAKASCAIASSSISSMLPDANLNAQASEMVPAGVTREFPCAGSASRTGTCSGYSMQKECIDNGCVWDSTADDSCQDRQIYMQCIRLPSGGIADWDDANQVMCTCPLQKETIATTGGTITATWPESRIGTTQKLSKCHELGSGTAKPRMRECLASGWAPKSTELLDDPPCTVVCPAVATEDVPSEHNVKLNKGYEFPETPVKASGETVSFAHNCPTSRGQYRRVCKKDPDDDNSPVGKWFPEFAEKIPIVLCSDLAKLCEPLTMADCRATSPTCTWQEKPETLSSVSSVTIVKAKCVANPVANPQVDPDAGVKHRSHRSQSMTAYLHVGALLFVLRGVF